MQGMSSIMMARSVARSAVLAVLLASAGSHVLAQEAEEGRKGKPGERRPLVIAEQGTFFVGGRYSTVNDTTRFVGQMYVEYEVPERRTQRYPMVFIHGGGQIGSGWWTTPDGREGWAKYFLRRGYAVYVVDQPGRGRSAYNSELGPLNDPAPVLRAQQIWAAHERFDLWPQARLHTQWVGSAEPGDPTFDQFMRSQSDAIADPLLQETLTADGLVALLDRIGPAILVPHSQPGAPAWLVADRRPNKVKALVQLEPGGPPVTRDFPEEGFATGPTFAWGITRNPITYRPAASDTSELEFVPLPRTDPDVATCWVQAEPARQLPNLRMPILLLTSPSGYNATWDPCLSKFLTQAGVEHTWLKLQDIGIHGNGHFYFIERNSDRVAGVVLRWLRTNVPDQQRAGEAVSSQ